MLVRMHALADTAYSTRCNCSVGTEVHLKAGLMIVCYCSQLHITTPSDHVSYSFTPLITSLSILLIIAAV